MGGYVFPCKTNGQCLALLFESYGWHIRIYSSVGYRRMFGVKYRCCTQCHLPINKRESDWLNKELGYTPNDIDIDPNFLDLLNGIE